MNMNTSPERVDWLIKQSDQIYADIDQPFNSEPIYRRILRLGINSTALALRDGAPLPEIGKQLLTLDGRHPEKEGPLDILANQYADIERATLDHEGNSETDARHAIHLMKLAVPYAMKYYPKLDTGKIAAYSLTHDIVEAYANDTPSLGMTPEQKIQKDLIEAQAMETLRKTYGRQWPEFIDLIEHYEALGDAEARFTKAFDKLDPGFTHFYNQGLQLRTRYSFTREEFIEAIALGTERMQDYAADFPFVLEDRQELTTRVADLAYEKAAQ